MVISTPEQVEALEGYRFLFSQDQCEAVAADPSARCAAVQVLSHA